MKIEKHTVQVQLPIYWPRIESSGRKIARWLLPTPGNVLFTLLIVAGLIWAANVGALPGANPLAAPEAASTGTIAYQGRLADTAGTPLTATYPMIFRLYSAATGGTPLWEEQWTGANSVQVSDGLFNVMMGSLTAIPQSIVTGNSSLWLGITVGTDNEMTPRVQLGSVPFAVQASTVPNGSVTTAKIANGAVTQAKLGADVSLVPPDGSITTAKIADGAVTQAKQTIAAFHVEDSSAVRLQGQTNSMLVSRFQIDAVPAGDVVVIATLMAYRVAGASPHGSVWLDANGARLNTIPLHGTEENTNEQLTLHGYLPAFSGGQLVVQVMAASENTSVNIVFGGGDDPRFGRHLTIMAGL